MSAPTNGGLELTTSVISFDELFDNIAALWEVNRVLLVEIPDEGYNRRV
jgi:hypothetical protein